MNQSLRAALAQGKTEAVIAELLHRTTHDADLHDQVVALSARYAQYEKQYFGNLEDPSVLNIELNKINAAALEMIEQLEAAQTPPAAVRANSWVKILAITTVLAVLVAIVVYFGSLFGKKETPAPAPTTTTTPAPQSAPEQAPVSATARPETATPQSTLSVTCKTNKGRGDLYFKNGQTMRFYAKAN